MRTLFLITALLNLGLSNCGVAQEQEDQPAQVEAFVPGALALQAVPADQDNAIETQHIAQLQTHLKSQLSFAKCALELSEEQTEKFATFDKNWLVGEYRSAGGKKAKPKNPGMLGQMFGGGAIQAENGQEDASVKKLKTHIEKKIGEVLTEDQKEQLKQERKAKEDFRAKALAEFAVAMVERHVHVSEEQAVKLVPELTGKINKSCGWAVFLNNPQYIPTLPTAAISRVLNEAQLQTIRSLNQQDFVGNSFQQMFGNDPFGGEEAVVGEDQF
jgi:hypothetical protein